MAAKLWKSGGRGVLGSVQLQRVLGFSSASAGLGPAAASAETSAAALGLKSGSREEVDYQCWFACAVRSYFQSGLLASTSP